MKLKYYTIIFAVGLVIVVLLSAQIYDNVFKGYWDMPQEQTPRYVSGMEDEIIMNYERKTSLTCNTSNPKISSQCKK